MVYRWLALGLLANAILYVSKGEYEGALLSGLFGIGFLLWKWDL